MKIHIAPRHLEVTEDIRDYIERRARKIESIFNRIVDLQAVIELEKNRYLTEITLATRKATFHAQAETHDVFSSLDSVLDKIEAQIRRYKERISDRRHQLSRRDVAVQLSGAQEETPDMEAAEEVDDTPVTLVRDPARFAAKPMTAEEAAMQLRASGDALLLFVNAQTNQINLVYEDDGAEYGWVEPEFD